MPDSIYKRMIKLMSPFWVYIIISSVSAIIFVLLNSASIWLTATLINNILLDFDKIVQSQMEWSSNDNLTLNEKLKFYTNLIILRETPAESLRVLCVTILSVFFGKNIYFFHLPWIKLLLHHHIFLQIMLRHHYLQPLLVS